MHISRASRSIDRCKIEMSFKYLEEEEEDKKKEKKIKETNSNGT